MVPLIKHVELDMQAVPLFLEDGSPVVEYSLLREKMHPKGICR